MSPTTYTGPFTSRQVRQEFFNFYQSRGHSFVPSSPTVSAENPTRLFANAGMNQFRPIFLGTVDPQSEMAKLQRAYNSQKCIRIGDLEDVGKDTYHHTFFEMLGNWSFGDYTEKEALSYAWEFLTEVYQIPKDRLYVTYFEGDSKSGLAPDEESRQIWLDLGISEDHILPGSMEDNFWDMDARDGTGPCGPCTELHFDRIGGRNAAHLVNKDDPDVVEFWNHVFIRLNREYDGSYSPLPQNHVDSAMGFERLVSVIQGQRSNYDIDLFTPILQKIQEVSGMRPYLGKVGEEDKDGVDTAYRAIADHIRTLAFSLSDGGTPSDAGRGYVLRRILRRGLWYVRMKLNVPIGSFFSSLYPTIIEVMGEVFPELTKRVDETKAILDEEEALFSRTFDDGVQLFKQYAAEAQKSGAKKLKEEDVWRLYDTYGFPIDLTRLMAEELGLGVDKQDLERTEEARFTLGW